MPAAVNNNMPADKRFVVAQVVFIAADSHQSWNHEWQHDIACIPRWFENQADHVGADSANESPYGTEDRADGPPAEPATFDWRNHEGYGKQRIPPLSLPDAHARTVHVCRRGTGRRFRSGS